MTWEQARSNSLSLSISLIALPRKNVGLFFHNMISRWLIPGKNLDVSLSFSTHFKHGEKEYVISQLILRLADRDELECAKRNLPFLEKEILMGAKSMFHARKILEMKGLNLDDKTSYIQEKIAGLVRRFPKIFDYDLFSEMQSFLVSSKSTFKSTHQPLEMCRIIFTLYRFRKILEQKTSLTTGKRHLCLKMKKTILHTPFGQRDVLSIFLGLNFLNEHELFEERHLLSAISHFIPEARLAIGSYFVAEDRSQQIQTLYLEVEKASPFLSEELAQLRQGLANEIQKRIEQLVPPIFMPRNEEEVMRNILILSQQLHYTKDIPQMVISFEEQSGTQLCFTVILVRLLHPESRPIAELFQESPLASQIFFDRTKVVGRLRRKIPKEASVFRVRLPNEPFIREDYSVDLFGARLHLVKEIHAIIGDVRDYNGGMISKQSENFLRLKELLGKQASQHGVLLQNFFHSIYPAHLSSTLDPKLLQILFNLLLDTCYSKENGEFRFKRESSALFVIIKPQDRQFKDHVMERFNFFSNELLTVQIQIFDALCLGFIYLNIDSERQDDFLAKISETLSFPLVK